MTCQASLSSFVPLQAGKGAAGAGRNNQSRALGAAGATAGQGQSGGSTQAATAHKPLPSLQLRFSGSEAGVL